MNLYIIMFNIDICMNIFKSYLIYSFLGWTCENLKNINDKNFISCNPIFKYLSNDICLIPFPPVYGLAGIFIWYLHNYHPNLSLTAKIISFFLVFNMMELIGGYIGEKYVCNHIDTCQVHNKMWNYKKFGNINGYIDIEHSFYWIIMGLIGYYIYPYINKMSSTTLLFSGIIIWSVLSYVKYPASHN
jgi:hypothetical protein